MPAVAIDARMIQHSGIGVVLRGLFRQWSLAPPEFEIMPCGPKPLLETHLPSSLKDRIVDWRAPIYSASAAFIPPSFPRQPDAFYAPHYATCLRPGCPLVCQVQDVIHITHPTRKGTRLYNRLYLLALQERAAYVLTTSRHVKVQLQTLFGFAADRVLCTGLGPGIVCEGVEEGKIPDELLSHPYFVAVGIYKPHKNWDFLLEQFASLYHDVPHLLVCIGVGKDKDTLQAKARKLRIHKRVRIMEKISESELLAIYRESSALLYPSLAEGFGLPVLEAMSLGIPVVIADRSPMKEIAEGCGWKFDPDYPQSFTETLLEMLEQDGERLRRIDAGKKRATIYDWATTAKHVEHAIHRAMTGRLPEPLNLPR